MATKVIQIMEKTAEGYDELIPISGGINIRITSKAGTTVTCSFNGVNQSYTYNTDGVHDFFGSGYGEYTIIATNGTYTNTITKIFNESKLYKLTIMLFLFALSKSTISCVVPFPVSKPTCVSVLLKQANLLLTFIKK